MRDDVVLFLADAKSARRAVARLSRAGFDGENITFLTPVEVTVAGRYSDRQVDRGITRSLARRALIGGLIGAVVGVGPGILLLVAFQQASVTLVGAGAAAGGVFGWGIGVLVAFQSVPTMAPIWERTFAPLVPGSIPVLVVAESDKQRQRLDQIVRRTKPLAVLSYDEYRDKQG